MTASAMKRPEVVLLVAGVCAAMHVGKLPPALPVLQDAFGLSLVEAGFLLSLVQIAGMAGGIAIGLAADGIGLRRSVLAGLAILVATSATGGFARDAHQLMAIRAVEGVGFLIAILPVPRLLRALVPPTQVARTLGLWGAFMPAGTALALLAGPWVMAAAGWRGWWLALAVLTALVAGWTSRAIPPDVGKGDTDAPVDHALARLRDTLAAPGPWLVALIFAVYALQWMAIIGFLPTIYADAGISATTAGTLTALVAAVNAVGNVGAGRLLHRGVPPQRVLATGFVTMIVCAIVAFGLASELPFAARFCAVLVLTGVGGLIPGSLFPLAVALAPGPHTVSTTVGWMQQFSAAGQFAGPPLVAWVAAMAGGWQLTWVVTGAASLTGILLAMLIGRVHRHRVAG